MSADSPEMSSPVYVETNKEHTNRLLSKASTTVLMVRCFCHSNAFKSLLRNSYHNYTIQPYKGPLTQGSDFIRPLSQGTFLGLNSVVIPEL